MRKMPEFFLLLFFMVAFFSLIGFTLFSTGSTIDSIVTPSPGGMLPPPFTNGSTIANSTINTNSTSGYDPYFATFFDSVLTVFTLQTTAMYPEAMIPSYKKTPFASFYFIIYMIVQCFFILTLDLAMVYNIYKEELENVKLSNYVRNRVAILAAFKMLQEHDYNNNLNNRNNNENSTIVVLPVPPQQQPAQQKHEMAVQAQEPPQYETTEASDHNVAHVSKQTWLQLFMQIRPWSSIEKASAKFDAITRHHIQTIQHHDIVNNDHITHETTSIVAEDHVNLLQFIKLCSIIFVRIPGTQWEEKTRKLLISRSSWRRRCGSCCCKFKFLKRIVDSRLFKIMILAAVLASCALVIVELIQAATMSQYRFYTIFIEPFFIALFLMEMVLKILARGPCKYVAKKWNIFDASIVILSAILYFLNLVSIPILQSKLLQLEN